jgi:hypothetical protein
LPSESGFNHTAETGYERSGELAAVPALPARGDRLRLLLWAGISFIPPFLLAMLRRHPATDHDGVLTVGSELPFKAVCAFFVFLATWVVSRVEKRSLADYGMPVHRAFGGKFWEGSVWGFAMLSAVLLVLAPSGHFRIDSAALTGSAALHWGLAWGATFLAVSWYEEFTFRGYWLFFMASRLRFWPAALFLSGMFGVAHLGNHGENLIGIVHVVGTGLLFCLMIRRTGNLWFAAGYHAAWDWAESFFYGTPDSGLLSVGRYLNSSAQGPNWLTGGSAGPEGSVIAIVALAVCALLIHLRFPKVIYPDRPA